MLIFEDCLEMVWNEIKDRKGKLADQLEAMAKELRNDKENQN